MKNDANTKCDFPNCENRFLKKCKMLGCASYICSRHAAQCRDYCRNHNAKQGNSTTTTHDHQMTDRKTVGADND